MFLVCVWPEGVTQVSVMRVPEWIPSRVCMSDAGELIAWLFTLVMTSPVLMPASAAGVLHRDPSTSVPEPTGAIRVGIPGLCALWTQARGAGLAWPVDPGADLSC